MLNITKISQFYVNTHIQKKSVLKDITLTFSNGLYGLLGPNGAGKSTLINIITGSLKPSSGVVKWNDIPISRLGKKYRKILGFMPQQQTLYNSFTGRQFLLYICALKEIRNTSIFLYLMGVYARVKISVSSEKY